MPTSSQTHPTTLPAEKRSAVPGVRGLPWWGAFLLVVGSLFLGFFIDSGDNQLGRPYFALFAASCMVAVVLVEYRGLFVAAVQPPILMAASVPAFYHVMLSGTSAASPKARLLSIGYPLVSRFPLMVGVTVTVLVLALLRVLLVRLERTRDIRFSMRGNRPSVTVTKRADHDAPRRGGADSRGPRRPVAGGTKTYREDPPRRDDTDRGPRRPRANERARRERDEPPRPRERADAQGRPGRAETQGRAGRQETPGRPGRPGAQGRPGHGDAPRRRPEERDASGPVPRRRPGTDQARSADPRGVRPRGSENPPKRTTGGSSGGSAHGRGGSAQRGTQPRSGTGGHPQEPRRRPNPAAPRQDRRPDPGWGPDSGWAPPRIRGE